MSAHSLVPVLHYLHHLGGAEGEPPLSDGMLLQRFVQSGDATAFELLLRRHGPLVLGVCRRLLRAPHDVEDAFQATFIIFLRKAGSLRQPEQVGPWLYGVASRVARKARMLAERRRQREAPLAEPEPDRPPSSDLSARIDEAIAGLPRHYREPVILCYLQGLSHAEAAHHLGCAAATVATRLARARERLRTRLLRHGVCLPASALPSVLLEGAPALPSSLLAASLRAVTSLGPSGTIPAHLAPLTEGVCNAMFVAKWKTILVLLVLGLAGGLCAYRAGAADPDLPPPATVPPLAENSLPRPVPPPTEPEDPGTTTIRSANFTVTASSRRVAQLVASAAESQRKALAQTWHGAELPPWPKPCPLTVKLTANGSGGATSFTFDKGTVLSRNMQVEGTLERVLACVIPHEVAHTVLADHFGKAVPRWADEGTAVLAEDDVEQKRHDQVVRQILDSPGRAIPLRRLLGLKEYPRDVMALFAEGYSLTRFLVERKDHKTFLAFVKTGDSKGWDEAVKTHYGLRDVTELEDVWLAHLKRKRGDKVAPPHGHRSGSPADRPCSDPRLCSPRRGREASDRGCPANGHLLPRIRHWVHPLPAHGGRESLLRPGRPASLRDRRQGNREQGARCAPAQTAARPGLGEWRKGRSLLPSVDPQGCPCPRLAAPAPDTADSPRPGSPGQPHRPAANISSALSQCGSQVRQASEALGLLARPGARAVTAWFNPG